MKRAEAIFLEGARPYVWILSFAVIVYSATLSFGFTHLDDNEFILENFNFIKNVSNIGQVFLGTIFSNATIPYYRPILNLSFMIDAQMGGRSPFVYHLTNLVLHGIAACLLFLLLIGFSFSKPSAFIFSAAFCVHPVLAQAVAWIPGRNDLLLAIFTMTAVLALLEFCRSGSRVAIAASVFFFGLSLFTKESAIILLGLCVIFLAFRGDNIHVRESWPVILASWGLMVVFWFLMRSAALFSVYDKSTLGGMYESLTKSMPAMLIYVGKIFLPFNLSVYPTIADSGVLYGIAGLLVTIVIGVTSKERDWRLAVLGGVWFLFFLSSSFIRPSAECVLDFQEHRLYVPLIGFIIMLAGMGFLDGVDLRSKKTLAVFIGVMLIFSVLTFRHEWAFKDRETFWSNAVRTAPRTAFVHLRRGFISYLDKFNDRAFDEYKKAIALDPELPAVHTKLGLLYMDRRMYKEAASEFREEIRLSPAFDVAYMCLGVVKYKERKFADAERLWKKAMRVNPYSVEARKNLAIYYYERGDEDRSACYARQLRDMGIPVPKEYLSK